MDAATIAALLYGASQGASSIYGDSKNKEANKQKELETRRATLLYMINDALKRQTELQGQQYSSSQKMGKSSSNSLMDTAATMRGIFQ